jgi:hypothetical protein
MGSGHKEDRCAADLMWRQSGAKMDRNSAMTGRLMVHAFCGAVAAFVFGLCVGHILIRHFDGLYTGGAAVSLAALILVLFWTRHAVQGFAVSEASRKDARQFLWSCVFFAMISSTFGLQVSGITWFRTDFLREFALVFWGAMTLVAIYPVRRDARRLANSASSQVASD